MRVIVNITNYYYMVEIAFVVVEKLLNKYNTK